MIRLVLTGAIMLLGWAAALQNSLQAEPPGLEASVRKSLERLVKTKAAKAAGIAVYDLKSGQRVFAIDADKALKPASVLKVLTSIAALKELGGEYSFKTAVYAEKANRSAPGRLWVKGGADPSLSVESAWLMARRLKKMGLEKFSGLGLDTTLLAEVYPVQGQRAYQTGAAALTFNYNSLAFNICPAAAGQRALVSVDPWEMPVSLSGAVLTKKVKGGALGIDEQKGGGGLAYGLSGSIAPGSPCLTVYRSVAAPEQMFAAAFGSFLELLGISGAQTQTVVYGAVPAKAVLLFEQESQPLAKIIRDLNHFSTNVVAEQLVYALGSAHGGIWSRRLGLERMGLFLKGLGLPGNEFELHDGSGLSHANKMSADSLARLLKFAWGEREIQAEFEGSLPWGGRSGTLKKRKWAPASALLRAKTGTLDGVSSLAGYLYTAGGRGFAFCILQNETASRQKAWDFEDEFLSALSAL